MTKKIFDAVFWRGIGMAFVLAFVWQSIFVVEHTWLVGGVCGFVGVIFSQFLASLDGGCDD